MILKVILKVPICIILKVNMYKEILIKINMNVLIIIIIISIMRYIISIIRLERDLPVERMRMDWEEVC